MRSFKTMPARLYALFASPRGWLTLLLLFHCSINVWWLSADNHAIRTDEETHMIMARDYYNALFPRVGDRSLGARLAALGRIKADVGNPVHPPLLHITGALFARVLGYSVDRMAFVNTVAFLAAIIGVYLLARRFLKEEEAFFAALVFSLTPMIYASSRYFMTDFLSMALVVWVMYALLKSEYFTSLRWSAVYGLLNGLALMTRTTAVLYYFIPSLVVFVIAVIFLFERKEQARHFNQVGLAKLVLHALLILIIVLAVCSPWYIAHGGQFYRHWMKPEKGGVGSPVALLSYEAPESEEMAGNREEEDARPESDAEPESNCDAGKQASAPSPGQQEGGWRFFLNRSIGWIRYPVFVINNAVFLPMFLMSLLGMAVVLVCSKFRGRVSVWLLICWLLGSYGLLTLALNFATPRYAMQALPALALLSVLPVFALPRGRLRLGAQGLYLAILAFQFGNLTVHAYGPFAEAKLPLILDKKYQAVYDDPGLYFFKPVLHASSAYGRMQAPTKNNFKDRLFFSMLKAEQERPYHGIEAPYTRLNIRGMILDEAHFWLDGNGGNPFRRHDIPPGLAPYRNFRHYGWGKDMESVLPVLHLVDYVAYTTEGITPETDRTWQRTLEEKGFEVIDRFHEPRYGMVLAMDYVLMARRADHPLPKPASLDDIWKLSLQQLYAVRYSAVFRELNNDLQEALTARMNSLFEKVGRPLPLNDQVDFRGAHAVKNGDEGYMLHLIFYVRKPVSLNYRMLFRGIVKPEYMASHFKAQNNQAGLFRWNFDPTPAPKQWLAQEYVIVRFPMDVPSIPYELSFAFYAADQGVWGDAVNLGEIDFSTVE